VKAGLGMIIEDPFCGKALKEELEGLLSFRVGRFGIVYRISELIAVGPRKAIYEIIYRLIKKRRGKDRPLIIFSSFCLLDICR
jgi:phage-related holin